MHESAAVETASRSDTRTEVATRVGVREIGAAPVGITPSTGSAANFLRFASGFWLNGRTVWLLAAAMLGLLLLNLLVNIGFNRWHRWFFDMLERREGGQLLLAVGALAVLIVSGAAFAVAMVKCRMTLQLEWRRWLTTRLLSLWSKGSAGGLAHLTGENHGSPEYRLVEDARLALDPVVDLSVGLANSLILGVTFVGILITLGGSMSVELMGLIIVIPGYLALAAVAYAALASVTMHIIGQPLIRRVAEKSEAEAQFLFELTRQVESREPDRRPGSRAALDQVMATFEILVRRWRRVIREHCRLTWLTNSNSFLAPFLPLILAAPKYVSGELSLGAVMQAAAAFTVVLGALNWFTENYVRVAEWSASARRIDELLHDLKGPHI